ncbi:hypothetical protein BC828DRAFT_386197, partial [Blastocladiella britannica]
MIRLHTLPQHARLFSTACMASTAATASAPYRDVLVRPFGMIGAGKSQLLNELAGYPIHPHLHTPLHGEHETVDDERGPSTATPASNISSSSIGRHSKILFPIGGGAPAPDPTQVEAVHPDMSPSPSSVRSLDGRPVALFLQDAPGLGGAYGHDADRLDAFLDQLHARPAVLLVVADARMGQAPLTLVRALRLLKLATNLAEHNAHLVLTGAGESPADGDLRVYGHGTGVPGPVGRHHGSALGSGPAEYNPRVFLASLRAHGLDLFHPDVNVTAIGRDRHRPARITALRSAVARLAPVTAHATYSELVRAAADDCAARADAVLACKRRLVSARADLDWYSHALDSFATYSTATGALVSTAALVARAAVPVAGLAGPLAAYATNVMVNRLGKDWFRDRQAGLRDEIATLERAAVDEEAAWQGVKSRIQEVEGLVL